MSWPGAVGAAWVALLSLSLAYRGQRGSRISPGWLGDGLYPLLPPLSISIWLGCWVAGVAYGRIQPAGTWWAVPSLDESGTYNLHWPLQLLSAFSLIAFFGFLELLVKQPRPPGRLSGLAALGLMVHLLFASLLRADPGLFWDGMRADTWMAIAYLAGLMVLMLVYNLVSRFWRKPTLSNSFDS